MRRLLCWGVAAGCALWATGQARAAEDATGYIGNWAICGPFANDNDGGFDTAYGPEQTQPPAPDGKYDGVDGKATWRLAAATDGAVNFLPLYPNRAENAVVYAYAQVTAPAAVDCDLSIGSDDGLKVWLNGALVHSNNAARALTKDEDKVKVSLKAGANDLLVKVVQGAGEWGLAAQFTKKEASVDGITFGLGKFDGLITPFVGKWLVVGPFDNDNDGGFDTAYAPEKALDFAAEVDGAGGKVKWKEATAGENGQLDFEPLYPDKHTAAVAYAYVTIKAPREIACKLLLGSDDGAKVWLNGTLVHTNPAARPLKVDEDQVDVTLAAGENKLLVKVSQGEGQWALCTRFAQTKDSLTGVEFVLPGK